MKMCGEQEKACAYAFCCPVGMCGLAGQGRQLGPPATEHAVGRAHSSQGCTTKESKQRCGDVLGLNPVCSGMAVSPITCRSMAPCARRELASSRACPAGKRTKRRAGRATEPPLPAETLQQGRGPSQRPTATPGGKTTKFFCQEKRHQPPSTCKPGKQRQPDAHSGSHAPPTPLTAQSSKSLTASQPRLPEHQGLLGDPSQAEPPRGDPVDDGHSTDPALGARQEPLHREHACTTVPCPAVRRGHIHPHMATSLPQRALFQRHPRQRLAPCPAPRSQFVAHTC